MPFELKCKGTTDTVTSKNLELDQRAQDEADNTLTMGLGYEKTRQLKSYI